MRNTQSGHFAVTVTSIRIQRTGFQSGASRSLLSREAHDKALQVEKKPLRITLLFLKRLSYKV